MGRTSDAKDRLLESAEKLLRERGYNAVGVSDLCKAAEVNKGSFYHFFPSKQSLALEVIDRAWQQNREGLETALLGETPPLDRLRGFFAALYEQHQQECSELGQQQGCMLANLATEMSTQDPLVRQRLLQAFEGQVSYFESVIREARDRGDIPQSVDPKSAAESIFALLEGKIMFAKLRNDYETLKNLTEEVFRLIKVETWPTS